MLHITTWSTIPHHYQQPDEHLFNGRTASITHTCTNTPKAQKRRLHPSERNNNHLEKIYCSFWLQPGLLFPGYFMFIIDFFLFLWKLLFSLLRHVARAAGTRAGSSGVDRVLMLMAFRPFALTLQIQRFDRPPIHRVQTGLGDKYKHWITELPIPGFTPQLH